MPRIFLIVCILLTGMGIAKADSPFVLQPLRILLGGDLGVLEALFVRPSEPGRYPLALLAHGSPRSAASRVNMTPLGMLPQALEFARRGWAVVIVMRRGYGGSDGGWAESFGSCDNPNYIAAGNAAAADLKTTLEFVSHRPDVDPNRMIAVGVSAGGFATVALTADPPPGLVAAISFAGGRGSPESDKVCHPERLIDAFRTFGQRSRVPMLWVYAANDHFFAPALAQQLKAAFTSGGSSVDFVAAPAFGEDGHYLFSPAGIPDWTPDVDDLPATAEFDPAGNAAAVAASCHRRTARVGSQRAESLRHISHRRAAQGLRTGVGRLVRLEERNENRRSGARRRA